MALPLAALLALALAWSGYWYFTLANAEHQLGRWRERLAATGGSLSCAELAWGGYPFRIEMTCTAPRLAASAGGGRHELTGTRLTTLAQAWRPQHVLALFDGPLMLRSVATASAASRPSLAASGKAMTASLVFAGKRLDQLSVLAEQLEASVAEAEGFEPTLRASLARLQVHHRLVAPPANGLAAVAIAAEAGALRLGGAIGTLAGLGTLAIDAMSLDALVERLPYPLAAVRTAPARTLVDSESTLKINGAQLSGAGIVVNANGRLALDSGGRVNGRLATRVTRLRDALDRLRAGGRIDGAGVDPAEALMSLLQGSSDPATGAVNLDIAVKGGKVYLGPFKVMTIPPLL